MQYPIPNTSKLLQNFKGKSYLTCLDFKCGYWHVPLRKEDREKTAFVFNQKLYVWNVMPWGFSNCPAYFQYIMYKLFGHLPYVQVYLDDVTIMSESEDRHIMHLKEVFDILVKNNVKLRIDKCAFAQSDIQYLGFITNKYGIRVTRKYKDKILNIVRPKNKKEVQRFMGLVNYVHRFIPELYKYIMRINKLTHKNNKFVDSRT